MIKEYKREIEQIYETIRTNQKKLLQERKKEIYSNIPEIKKIEKQIEKLCISLAINSLKNTHDIEKYIKNVREQIMDLKIKKTELLVANNYPMDYLELHYECPKCKDTGFINGKECSCYKQKLIRLLYKNSNLATVLKENNFSNFNLEYFSVERTEAEGKSPRKNMKKILASVRTYLKNFDSTNDNLLFYGSSGTGKTFLSHCIAKNLLSRGFLVIYKTAKELFDDLKEIRFSNNKSLESLLMNCDLLIIDDLGTEQITDFSKTELFNLLNTKLLNKNKMIISTNYSLEELPHIYSERITSRLFGDFILFKFFGTDIRVQKNLNKSKPI